MPTNIKLWCTENEKTYELQIFQGDRNDQIRELINVEVYLKDTEDGNPRVASPALDVALARMFTEDTKTEIINFNALTEGQVVFVTSSFFKCSMPYAPMGYKLYRDEESADVGSWVSQSPWCVGTI
jgi:hypothetical protein